MVDRHEQWDQFIPKKKQSWSYNIWRLQAEAGYLIFKSTETRWHTRELSLTDYVTSKTSWLLTTADNLACKSREKDYIGLSYEKGWMKTMDLMFVLI